MKRERFNATAAAVSFAIVGLIFVSGCKEKKDTVVNAELNQYSREVDAIPTFDGATCLVCINVHGLGASANLDWAVQAKGNPNHPQWNDAQAEAAILADIDAKIAQCPPGSSVKLQFMYHYDPKPLYERAPDGKIRHTYQWGQYKSVEAVLRSLAARPDSSIAKVYLTSCLSGERTSTVSEAFKLLNVTHVVTTGEDDTILLECGGIAGAKYPTFEPEPVRIVVWEREGDKLVAKVPKKKIDKDKKFDINTNTVKNR